MLLGKKVCAWAIVGSILIFLSACSIIKLPSGADSAPSVVPDNIAAVPDAVPKIEPIYLNTTRPYTIMGVQYTPMTELRPYRARGIASWYGQKFHGNKTANGETYDMFAMTAAHPTLPIPSYVRVTRVIDGQKSSQSVVVRVNDRGPFLHQRAIDLSYVAAYKLGFVTAGTAEVDIETVFPEGTRFESSSAALPPASTSLTYAPQDTPIQPLQSGFIIQLGVFQSRVNAEAFFEHIRKTADSTRFPPRMDMRSDGKFRVYIGTYKTRAEAQRAARAFSETFGLDTYLTTNAQR